MVASAPKTIVLKGDPRYDDAVAGGAITPGHLIAPNAAGAVVVHPTAGAFAERAFAVEDDGQGKSIGDAYASGAQVHYALCRPGDVIYAILADSMNIVIGDRLESAGDGTLREHVPQVGGDSSSPAVGIRIHQIVGVALEAVTTSGATSRLMIRVV